MRALPTWIYDQPAQRSCEQQLHRVCTRPIQPDLYGRVSGVCAWVVDQHARSSESNIVYSLRCREVQQRLDSCLHCLRAGLRDSAIALSVAPEAAPFPGLVHAPVWASTSCTYTQWQGHYASSVDLSILMSSIL